jgi:hypothetical protein
MIRYLNCKTYKGVETIEQVELEKGQTLKEFKEYVDFLINEYSIAGIEVYMSCKCSKDWSNK